MAKVVEFEVVKHRGDWATLIDGVVYDDPDKFAKDFPDQSVRFDNEPNGGLGEFSWQEMHKDMVDDWGLGGRNV